MSRLHYLCGVGFLEFCLQALQVSGIPCVIILYLASGIFSSVMPAQCLPRGTSLEAFQAASYMVEVYWYSYTFEGILGVLCIESTGQSNTTRNFHKMWVWFIPGADPASIIGGQQFRPLGSVLEFFGANAHAKDLVTCIRRVHNAGIYHAWFGYSMWQYTEDNFHCCDMYLQSPDRLLSGMYIHFLMRDLYDPGFWNVSERLEFKGVVSIPDDTFPLPERQLRRINVIARHLNP